MNVNPLPAISPTQYHAYNSSANVAPIAACSIGTTPNLRAQREESVEGRVARIAWRNAA